MREKLLRTTILSGSLASQSLLNNQRKLVSITHLHVNDWQSLMIIIQKWKNENYIINGWESFTHKWVSRLAFWFFLRDEMESTRTHPRFGRCGSGIKKNTAARQGQDDLAHPERATRRAIGHVRPRACRFLESKSRSLWSTATLWRRMTGNFYFLSLTKRLRLGVTCPTAGNLQQISHSFCF